MGVMATMVVNKYGGLPPLELDTVLLAQDISCTASSKLECEAFVDEVVCDAKW